LAFQRWNIPRKLYLGLDTIARALHTRSGKTAEWLIDV